MAEEKVRFQIRIAPETDKKIKSAMPLANCRSQNEFVEQAILHYCGCLQSESGAAVLAPALVDALRATVKEGETHICRLLFKLAVEMGIMMNILAYGMEVDPVALDQLRGKCVQDIKRTNGIITFKDAVMYQNHMID